MDNPQSRYAWLDTIGQFAAWVVASVVALLDALYIRTTVQAILRALRVIEQNAFQQRGGIGIDFQFGYALSAFDLFFLLILGCAALAVVIGSEYYFRKGRPKGLLWKRVGKVLGIELAVLLLCLLILLIL
jgi:hypothetical protein